MSSRSYEKNFGTESGQWAELVRRLGHWLAQWNPGRNRSRTLPHRLERAESKFLHRRRPDCWRRSYQFWRWFLPCLSSPSQQSFMPRWEYSSRVFLILDISRHHSCISFWRSWSQEIFEHLNIYRCFFSPLQTLPTSQGSTQHWRSEASSDIGMNPWCKYIL